MHSEICPVCEGTGNMNDKQCHGCVGKGWVEVNDNQFIYPYSPSVTVPYKEDAFVWPPNNTVSGTETEPEIWEIQFKYN